MSSAYTRGDGTGSGRLDAAARHGLDPDEAEDYGATNTRRVGCHGSRSNGGGKSGLASLLENYESTDNEESPAISGAGRQPASSGSGSHSGSSSGGAAASSTAAAASSRPPRAKTRQARCYQLAIVQEMTARVKETGAGLCTSAPSWKPAGDMPVIVERAYKRAEQLEADRGTYDAAGTLTACFGRIDGNVNPALADSMVLGECKATKSARKSKSAAQNNAEQFKQMERKHTGRDS
eukprot:SAG25_NODE_4469_length_808_cov_1.486601_1_plen_235_part_01